MYSVYILKSEKRHWYYVGSTDNIYRRIGEHNRREVTSTKLWLPLRLVYIKEFQLEIEARRFEKKLKQCRREKEALIRSIEKEHCRVVQLARTLRL